MVSAIAGYEIASILGPIVVASVTGAIERRRHNGEVVLDGNVRSQQIGEVEE
jgi:hypothetical protein